MDIVDARVDQANPVVATLSHPQTDIAPRHPFAPADQKQLPEIKLQHAGQNRAAGEKQEDDELRPQRIPVTGLDRVEERCVPLVDQNRQIDNPKLSAYHASQQPSRTPAIVRSKV